MNDYTIGRNATWGLTAIIFILSLALFYSVFGQFVNLHDGDGYLHLAVARAYIQDGFFDNLSWARFSAMYDHFGDKEFLFHLLLMPFVALLPISSGAALALATFNAAAAAVIANLSIRAIGKWGLLVPLFLFATSASFTLRMTRLRPEIFAVTLLILATWFASQRKYRWLMLTSCVYALSYTAFHALLGLSVGWFLYIGWISRKWDWRLLVYPTLGVGAGLILHPNFPSNCYIWWIQSVEFFNYKAILPVGNEIQSVTSATILDLNFGWLLGLAVLWRSGEKSLPRTGDTGPEAFFLVSAVAFTLLYLLMQRFSIYCIPFVTLYLLFQMRKQGMQVGRWTYLPYHGKLPFVLTITLVLSTSVVSCWHVFYNLKNHGVYAPSIRENWENLSTKLPENAKVVAPWSSAELYVWAAPQAKYLNVLDPVFMAVANPQHYKVQDKIWSHKEPDVPLAAGAFLDSDFILFPKTWHSTLYLRLRNDPRVELLQDDTDALFYIKPRRPDQFVLDWRLAPHFDEHPPDYETVMEKAMSYPRFTDGRAKQLEAYIDGRRLSKTLNRFNFVHIKEVEQPATVTYELAAYGPATFWHNNEKIIEVRSPQKARLGNGVVFTLELDRGRHMFTVQTQSYESQAGFYLVERSQSSRSSK